MLAAIEQEPGIPLARLQGMTTPTLLLASDRDRARWEAAEEAAHVMSNARTVQLEGDDHATTVSDRARVVAHALPFLQAVTAGEPSLCQ